MKRIDFSDDVAFYVKADKATSRDMWEKGDRLVRKIGKPGPSGEGRAGTFALLQQFSEELKAAGCIYEPHTLRTYWQVAARFPVESRYSSAPWHAHHIAGNPEMMKVIVEGAPRNQKITAEYATAAMRAMALEAQKRLEEETERRREAYEAAKKEREEAEEAGRRASSQTEKKAAKERADAAGRRQRANMTPAKLRDLPPSKVNPQEMSLLLARVGFMRDIGEVDRVLSKLIETYEPFIPSLPDTDLENGHDEIMTLVEKARAFASKLKKLTGRSSHLSVISDAG
jgi:hypothetical protein